MQEPTPSGVPMDGLSAPEPSNEPTPPPPAAPEPENKPVSIPARSGNSRMVIIMIILAVVYAVPGIAIMTLFPRIDGALTGLRSAATLVFIIGGLLWLLLGVAGFLRISSLKDKPRTSFFATIRLVALVLPMIGISALVPLMINRAPALQLEILAPTSAEAFVAPVAVQFGMDKALTYFGTLGLTPLKYEWDYSNDGVIDQETFDPTSTFVISRAGVYSIVVTVTMTDGSRKRVLRRLVISRASFGVQPLEPIIDEPATLSLGHLFPKTSEQTPTVESAEWDFDTDGIIDSESSGLSMTHTFRRLGEHNVSVTLTLSNQTQQTLSRTVMVTEPPKQPFPVTLETEPSTLIGPPPFGVFFTVVTDEPVVSATWDFGDQKSAEGLRVAHQFAAVGSYTVTANVRSESGSIAKLTKHVRVTEPLDIRDLTFEGSPSVKNFVIEGAVPLTIDISPVTLQSLISFSWDVPDASESLVSGKSLHAVYRDEGRYFIDLLGIDPEERVYRKRITVNALPPESQVSFTMNPTAPTAPATVTFDASDTFVPSGEQITGFEWDFGDPLNAGGTKFSGARTEYKYDNPGTYVIKLTVRTVTGNSYSGNKTLVVRAPLLDACMLPSRTSGTAPLGVRFDSSCSTGDFTSLRWSFGDGAESDQESPTHVFLQPGEYQVMLTATTAAGQSAVASTTISVSP